MDFHRNSHPDCIHSDNPFHECASACLDRIAQGHVKKKNTKKQSPKFLTFSRSFGRKKKESSHSQPLSPQSANAYRNGGGGFENANSPKKIHHSIAVKKKTVSESDNSFSSSSFGDPNEKKLTQTFPSYLHDLLDQSKANEKIEDGSESRIFSFLSPPRSDDKESHDYNDHESNNEIGVELDLESVMSETFVSVGKYRVRSESSPILTDIIEKHGDIAQTCKLESDSMRSRSLECLCSLMLELRSTPVGKLTKVKVKEMLAVVKDLESVNIEVAWLRLVLEEFGKFQEDVESGKEKGEGLVKVKREELEGLEADLARMAEVRLRIEETRAKVVEMEMERLRMEKMGFKIEKFKGKSFLDELL